MKENFFQIDLQNISVHINLGWLEAERRHPQKIQVDISIRFLNCPDACYSDNLNGTISYDELYDITQNCFMNKSYHLLEKASYDIYNTIKSKLKKEDLLKICLTKTHTPIKAFEGQASFTYGDSFL